MGMRCEVCRRYVPLSIGDLQDVDYRSKKTARSVAVRPYLAMIEPVRKAGMQDYRLDAMERPERDPTAVDRLTSRFLALVSRLGCYSPKFKARRHSLIGIKGGGGQFRSLSSSLIRSQRHDAVAWSYRPVRHHRPDKAGGLNRSCQCCHIEGLVCIDLAGAPSRKAAGCWVRGSGSRRSRAIAPRC
jgi:hypothetical protein